MGNGLAVNGLGERIERMGNGLENTPFSIIEKGLFVIGVSRWLQVGELKNRGRLISISH